MVTDPPEAGRETHDDAGVLTSRFRKIVCLDCSNPCDAFIRIGHRTRSRKVERFLLGDVKSCCSDEIVNFTIEMAASTDPPPRRRHPILPDCDTGIGRPAVLDIDHAAACLQHSLHLPK